MSVIILVMELLSRTDAISNRSLRYFTGKPCKRGHISERYTKTSMCIECLHPSFDGLDSEQRRTQKDGLLTSLSQMKLIKIRLHLEDFELFQSAVLASAMARNPSIQLRHIRSRMVPRTIGAHTRIHGFMAFPEDESMLRALQDSLEAARKSSVSLLAQEKLQKALRDVAAEADAGWPKESDA